MNLLKKNKHVQITAVSDMSTIILWLSGVITDTASYRRWHHVVGFSTWGYNPLDLFWKKLTESGQVLLSTFVLQFYTPLCNRIHICVLTTFPLDSCRTKVGSFRYVFSCPVEKVWTYPQWWAYFGGGLKAAVQRLLPFLIFRLILLFLLFTLKSYSYNLSWLDVIVFFLRIPGYVPQNG